MRIVVGIGLACAPAVAQSVSVAVSVDDTSTHLVGGLGTCAIDEHGERVAFASASEELVAGDTNATWDVFVRHVATQSTVRVSVSETGAEFSGESRNPALSKDGRYVVFATMPNKVYVRDLVAITIENVNVTPAGLAGNGAAQTDYTYAITPDGRFVAFASYASNLVIGDTNSRADLFVRDRQLQVTERVSVSSFGEQADNYSVRAALSDDGRYVAFESYADNLVPGDANAWADVFVRDRWLDVTERVSLNAAGQQAHLGAYRPSMSADGRFVAFESASSNLVSGDTNSAPDVFVKDRQTGAVELVSSTPGGAPLGGGFPSLSADARFVAITSAATTFYLGDANNAVDVFVVDRHQHGRVLVGRAPSGDQANGNASELALSRDGQHVAFGSFATNLFGADTNGKLDYFVQRIAPAQPVSYCTAKTASLGCVPSISSSGAPSVSSLATFDVRAQSVLNQKLGYLFYGYGAAEWPFLGGTMCVQYPLHRTPALFSGGSPPPAQDCSGVLASDFNAWLRSNVDPALIAGTVMSIQFAFRDPGDPHKLGLSNALAFTVQD
jgi:Tol biopolymer transport system component